MTNLSGKCAIVGMGETAVGKRPDATTNSLHLEAIKACLEDAGIKASQVDGLLTNQPLNDSHRSYAVKLAHMAGINAGFATDLALGGATPIAMVQHAVMAIEAGMATTLMCVHARKRATPDPTPGHSIRRGDEHWEEPWGHFAAAGGHAFAAQRHMYEYGTKSEDLAHIAVSTRKHASLNKNATLRKPITIEDHQQSRMIVAPLHLLDCSLESDGGGAVLVTSVERARDFPKRPIAILGMGQHHPHFSLLDAPTLTTLGGKKSSEMAYRMAGLGPKDMDFAEIYDCFTITALITLEDYGFCAKGDGKDFVKDGRIGLGGELPLNTHGGLLSQAHLEGQLHITEAVKQLRGNEVEPERQVANAKVGIVSGHGGSLAMHATLILGAL
ncbi:MAG: thiolase family protein [Deltaproteobacteria bacterium]|nr:thiolase family protein [Deltaproteobacteria bacterium]MBI3063693.1 thiolase family protein [Deltaproteobacteria bacterium]